MPPALIYQNTTTPAALEPPEDFRGGAIPIPDNLAIGRSRSYMIALDVPFINPVSAPTIDPISVGWGDMSLEAALADGNLERVAYADGQEIEILGIFTKAVLIVYGPPAE